MLEGRRVGLNLQITWGCECDGQQSTDLPRGWMIVTIVEVFFQREVEAFDHFIFVSVF